MSTSGNIVTSSLTDSIPSMLSSARVIREYGGKMNSVADIQTLDAGAGLDWQEVYTSAITASSLSENETPDNPQLIEDTLFKITPVVTYAEICITDRVRKRVDPRVVAQLGPTLMNAILRLEDNAGILLFSGATTTLCGAGATLASGHLGAAKARISSNATEPWDGPVTFVGHGYQLKDIADEIAGGAGTYPVMPGITQEAYVTGKARDVAGVAVIEDGNIAIDSSDDAIGGVFASGAGGAIVKVVGTAPWAETKRVLTGGGADELYMFNESAWGERGISGAWLYGIKSDATAPTS